MTLIPVVVITDARDPEQSPGRGEEVLELSLSVRLVFFYFEMLCNAFIICTLWDLWII